MNFRYPIASRNLDCFHLSLQYAGEKAGADITPLFVDSWQFCFEQKLSLADGLMSSVSFCKETILKDSMGIRMEVCFEDMKERLQGRLDEVIAVAFADAYYCPWHRGYFQKHIEDHCFCIFGMNEKGFLCKDYYISTETVLLPWDHFNHGAIKIMFFSFPDENKDAAQGQLYKAFRGWVADYKMFSLMETFAGDLLKVKCVQEIFGGMEDVYLCGIIRGLKMIADGRIQFGYALNKLSLQRTEMRKELIAAARRLYDFGREWEKMNGSIIKLYYMQDKVHSVKCMIAKNILMLQKEEELEMAEITRLLCAL